MGRKKVTESDKELMNKLYLEIGTYAGVARKVGFSAGTVKRYIIPNYKLKTKEEKKFEGTIKEISDLSMPTTKKAWQKLFSLSEKELKDIEELREEI